MSTKRIRPTRRFTALVLAGALFAGACSSDDKASEDSDDEGSDSSEEVADGTRTVGAPEVPEECSATDGDDDSGALAEVEERGEPDASAAEEVTGEEPVVLVEGEGDVIIPTGTAEIHYSIFNPADGTVLESSWATGEPAPVPVAQVFPRFAEGVEGMKVGGRVAFTVAASDAGGGAPPPESGIGPDDELVFVVDLISVSEEAETGAAETDEDALAAAEERGAPEVASPEGDEATEELVVIDDVVGDGQVVCPGDTVVAHYTGVEAVGGEEFDSSWEGEPISFGLDGVIQGWTEGLVGMKVGGRRTLVIPAEQAYGEDPQGGQPGGVLVFTIDLVGVG